MLQLTITSLEGKYCISGLVNDNNIIFTFNKNNHVSTVKDMKGVFNGYEFTTLEDSQFLRLVKNLMELEDFYEALKTMKERKEFNG